jgi:NADP-dependent 3-hydroxy acid dehydrogenase YdfG
MNTILITGAASGIGRATAERFYGAGWCVGLFDMSAQPLTELSRTWQPERFRIQVADVTKAEEIGAAIDRFVEDVGRLDVLFNCAGLLEIGDFESIPLERHYQILDVNNKGVLNCCYQALRHLKRTPGARVISMSSASSSYGVPGFASYSASKFFVKGFTEALEMEWARYGIRVKDIEPPFVKTPMLAGKQTTLIDRMGVNLSPQDIAEAVFAAADDNAIHHPVSTQYRVMRLARKVLPDVATRTMMKLLSGY